MHDLGSPLYEHMYVVDVYLYILRAIICSFLTLSLDTVKAMSRLCGCAISLQLVANTCVIRPSFYNYAGIKHKVQVGMCVHRIFKPVRAFTQSDQSLSFGLKKR